MQFLHRSGWRGGGEWELKQNNERGMLKLQIQAFVTHPLLHM